MHGPADAPVGAADGDRHSEPVAAGPNVDNARDDQPVDLVKSAGKLGVEAAETNAEVESVPRLSEADRQLMNPYGEYMRPDAVRVASNPDLIELARNEPADPLFDRAMQLADTGNLDDQAEDPTAQHDRALTRVVDHFLKEEAVLSQMSEPDRQTYINLRAALKVGIDSETRQPVSLTVRPGLGTAAWYEGLRSAMRAQVTTDRETQAPLIDDNFVNRAVSTYMLGVSLDPATSSNGDLKTFRDDLAPVGYDMIMRGVGLIADQYAAQNNLSAADRAGLLEAMMGRIVYRQQYNFGRPPHVGWAT